MFKQVKTPHEFLLEAPRVENRNWLDMEEIADIIAAIHQSRFPVVEPQRMPVSLGHFEQTLALSRQMWKRVLAETDNDQEWIPNPRQTGAINVSVTQEMVENWLNAVTEAESVLQGKHLIPFWRGNKNRGINLRRSLHGAHDTRSGALDSRGGRNALPGGRRADAPRDLAAGSIRPLVVSWQDLDFGLIEVRHDQRDGIDQKFHITD